VDADVCLLNSGTLRGNLLLRPGLLRAWDTATILPYYNDTVVKVRVRGEAVLRALENSVSAWPDTDGRFCQVSGLRYVFDPNRPRGSRLLRESVWVLKRRRGRA
jgi:5'-nucleotidase